MKPRVKHRKLFYVPGMISLLLLPLLCLWFIHSNNYLKQYSLIDIAINDTFLKFNAEDPSKPIPINPDRKILNYIFNGNAMADELQLTTVRNRIKKLFREKDSINAIKITMGKHAKFQTFVSILDIFFIDKVPTYLINDNYLFVVYFPPDQSSKRVKKENFHLHGCMDCNYFAGLSHEKNQYWLYPQNIRQFWQILLSFLGIILLNLYVLIKFNKNRIYNQKSYI